MTFVTFVVKELFQQPAKFSRSGLVYLLFFLSGISGLIYQVVWVRVFGNVFGNTIYSASLVVAVFMLGLGVGSYLVGIWADRWYAAAVLPASAAGGRSRKSRPARSSYFPLQAYAYFELGIASIGFGISIVLPHLAQLSSLVSSYVQDSTGWYVLSTQSYLARIVLAVVLLTPITLLMGGTLTLLIRHLVRTDPDVSGWRIAALYGVNTAGAAVGCFLTDFTLVPAIGLRNTQFIAVLFNVAAAMGAWWIAHRVRLEDTTTGRAKAARVSSGVGVLLTDKDSRPLIFIALALALSGFAAMGMEILWFRHFSILLGGFRAVFSLLLTVILVGIGIGSLASTFVQTSTASTNFARPAQWLMVIQGVFVASVLGGLTIPDPRRIDATVMADPAYQVAAGAAVRMALGAAPRTVSTLAELWFNARPILLEVALPAILMGFSFPLANAIVQHAEHSVGRRAGLLYLANTVGAVFGSVAVGFLVLPRFGLQASTTLLMATAALAIVPLSVANRTHVRADRYATSVLVSVIPSVAALAIWLSLPSDFLIRRALGSSLSMPGERLLTLREGLNEAVAVTDVPGQGRRLLTNGHPMSATTRLSQRYMRALAHIPLLSMPDPASVLVIGFGVGNTTHAATLHPSVRRVEVADLSRDILSEASYFNDVNQDVLKDWKVVVYINDGRHHLQMQPQAAYDLITLEPPPIGYAGVAALYSREFYELARSRLKPAGYISQWLPAYQVPTATTLAMVRSFVDVFPQAVLLSGAEADLLLLGANGARIEIDPSHITARLNAAPAVAADLRRLDLGTAREIAGTFIGSAQKLANATREVAPVTDDRPSQEYGVHSLLNLGEGVPGALVDLRQISAWCPACFVDGRPAPLVEGLDTYLALLDVAYRGSPAEIRRARTLAQQKGRTVDGSAYLGEIVPESADLHNILGIGFAEKGRLEDAIREFREALVLAPDSAMTHWNLGAALAARGPRQEALAHLRRSVELDPSNGQAQSDLASTLLDAHQFAEAIDHFRAALRVIPDSAQMHNNLGTALAAEGRFDEAIDQFQEAIRLDPQSEDARRNLAQAAKKKGG